MLPYVSFKDHFLLARLLLNSTKSGGKVTSLDQYISRMKSGQKDIFYITGTSKEQLEKSPFLERLTKKDYEVRHSVLSWSVGKGLSRATALEVIIYMCLSFVPCL